MTDYTILMAVPQPGEIAKLHWVQYDRKNARSAEAAIRAALEGGAPEIADTYVAIPSRSWKPVTVKVETKTALRFS